MATKKRRPPEKLADVRIPGSLFSSLFYFFNAVQGQLIRDAAVLAFARKTGPNAGVVTPDDLKRAALVLLPSVAASVPDAPEFSETRHARRQTA